MTKTLLELPRFLSSMFLFLFVILEVGLSRSASSSSSPLTKDYCEGEVFQPRCSYDEVIMIESATYGRMRQDRCVKINMGYVGCQADVLSLADEKCSGRRSCDITIPDTDFEQRRPCLELKSYLHVSYHCTKVLTADSIDCRVSKYSRPNLLHPPTSGQLASILALETKCGSIERPWIIEVPHGQQINLTLIDFTTRHPGPSTTNHPPQGGGGGRVASTGCVRYAKVLEKSVEREGDESFAICGRQGRERRVYTSRGHVVRVVMEVDGENPNYFLIGYQAIGCPDPVLPGDQYFSRREDGDLLIGCRNSPDRWRITCRHDNQWQWDAAVNCTSANIISSEVVKSSREERSPNGVLIAVLCVMVILLAMLTALITVLLYKRHHRLRQPPFSGDRHQAVVTKTSKAETESVTYVANDTDYETKTSRKNQRYGRHVSTRHHHRHHHSDRRHQLYDSPITDPTKNQDRDRASEYEKVESCQSIRQFAHIWDTPLPKIPGQL